MKVLVIGNQIICEWLVHLFSGNGIELVTLCELAGVRTVLRKQRFDLVVVDGSFGHAEQACRHVRELSHAPLVVLTDERRQDWKGLESLDIDGCIPYRTKGAELGARLRAIVRRYGWNGNGKQRGDDQASGQTLNSEATEWREARANHDT